MNKCRMGLLIAVYLGISFANKPALSRDLSDINAISIEVQASPLLGEGQVVSLTPEAIEDVLAKSIMDAGFATARSASTAKLIVTVERYDSGKYLGGAKTARMQLEYRLTRASNQDVVSWSSSCEYKAKLDLQSSEKRNQKAVRECLNIISEDLKNKLRSL